MFLWTWKGWRSILKGDGLEGLCISCYSRCYKFSLPSSLLGKDQAAHWSQWDGAVEEQGNGIETTKGLRCSWQMPEDKEVWGLRNGVLL